MIGKVVAVPAEPNSLSNDSSAAFLALDRHTINSSMSDAKKEAAATTLTALGSVPHDKKATGARPSARTKRPLGPTPNGGPPGVLKLEQFKFVAQDVMLSQLYRDRKSRKYPAWLVSSLDRFTLGRMKVIPRADHPSLGASIVAAFGNQFTDLPIENLLYTISFDYAADAKLIIPGRGPSSTGKHHHTMDAKVATSISHVLIKGDPPKLVMPNEALSELVLLLLQKNPGRKDWSRICDFIAVSMVLLTEHIQECTIGMWEKVSELQGAVKYWMAEATNANDKLKESEQLINEIMDSLRKELDLGLKDPSTKVANQDLSQWNALTEDMTKAANLADDDFALWHASIADAEGRLTEETEETGLLETGPEETELVHHYVAGVAHINVHHVDVPRAVPRVDGVAHGNLIDVHHDDHVADVHQVDVPPADVVDETRMPGDASRGFHLSRAIIPFGLDIDSMDCREVTQVFARLKESLEHGSVDVSRYGSLKAILAGFVPTMQNYYIDQKNLVEALKAFKKELYRGGVSHDLISTMAG
jgi:hypothetical protein